MQESRKHNLYTGNARRGSYRNEDCCEWLQRLLRKINEPMHKVVVVCDNAPVLCQLESVFQEEEFNGASLLRLGPYSVPLNPIEECWSVLKSAMKKELATRMERLLAHPRESISVIEYILRFLEEVIDNNIDKITPNLCMKTVNHVQKHFASCLAMKNLNMGDIA